MARKKKEGEQDGSVATETAVPVQPNEEQKPDKQESAEVDDGKGSDANASAKLADKISLLVKTKDFLDELSFVANALVKKGESTNSIMSNVLLEADEKGGVFLTVVNYGLSLRSRVESEVKVQGSCLVDCARLKSVLSVAAHENTSMESSGARLTVKSAKGRWSLPVIAKDDYPAILLFASAEGESERLSGALLQSAINKVSFCVAPERTRYTMNTVFLSFEDKSFDVVATDGKRLGLVHCNWPTNLAGKSSLLDRFGASFLGKSLSGSDIEFKLSGSKCAVKDGCREYIVGLVEGHFPDYKAVIPNEKKLTFVLKKSDLERGLREIMPMLSKDSCAVKFSFQPKSIPPSIFLSSKSYEAGECNTDIDVAGITGDVFDIAFNPHYILEFLKVIDTEDISVTMNDPSSAGMFDVLDYKYICMPVDIS